MLKICLVFWESEPQYAYKLYAYKKKTCILVDLLRNQFSHFTIQGNFALPGRRTQNTLPGQG